LDEEKQDLREAGRGALVVVEEGGEFLQGPLLGRAVVEGKA
jgi:hypothetical protein